MARLRWRSFRNLLRQREKLGTRNGFRQMVVGAKTHRLDGIFCGCVGRVSTIAPLHWEQPLRLV